MSTSSDAASRRLAKLTAELEAVRAAEGIGTWSPAPGARSADGGGAEAAGPERPEGESDAGIPMPGRHASRRAEALLPPGLRGRVALGPAQAAVVAVLVAVGLAVTAWLMVRADGEEIAPIAVRSAAPSVTPSAATSADAATGPSAATGAQPGQWAAVPIAPGSGASEVAGTASGEVVVDVAGKVRRPGIVVLPAGSRVVDALDQAGGPRRGVSLTAINLARLLVDGEQILVGVKAPPGVAASAAPAPGVGVDAGGLVNLNTADQTQLEELPEVGPVTAEAIVAWRTEHGGFTAVEELLEVDGIGEKTLATIAPHVTV